MVIKKLNWTIMKKTIYKFWSAWMTTMLLCVLIFSACEDEEFSKDYDVPWPVPVITSISPTEAEIESQITITGENLDKTNRVTIGTAQAEIVSKSATQVVIKVPRLAAADKIKLTTSFKREALSESRFVPSFPKTAVTEWPAKIIRGQNFKIKGDNVDLITSVLVGSTEIAVDGSKGTSGEVTISTQAVDLSAVTTVVIKVKSAKGGIDGSDTSPAIPVEDVGTTFIPKPAVMLFDFEDNVNPFQVQSTLSPTATLDGASLPKARGEHYLSVTANNVTSWSDIGYIEIPTAADISEFTKPYISFLVNTNGNAGYFQLEDGNGNWYHFKQSPDDYKFSTTGWEWRSYNLNQVDDGKPFDLSNVKAKLMFKTGNVSSGKFEIHIDQVMFTDGPLKISNVLFDFEDGVNPYSGNATSSIKTSGTIEGGKYLSVTKANASAWDWTGDMASGPLDFGDLNDPYISFYVNTGSNYGNLQIEVTQDGTKWGSDPFKSETNDLGGYAVKTDGQWKMYSFRLKDLLVSKWGGTGTAFDPKGTVDYLKFGFTTGNVSGSTYEINIDYIAITDGPAF
jgi:hypothetical protein